MRASPVFIGVAVAAVLLASGCLHADRFAPKDGGADHADDMAGMHGDMHHEAAAADLSGFQIVLRDCREGGGVSLYNMEEGSSGPVEPFQRTSVSDDVGDPLIASYGEPIPPGGATWGIWHTSVICGSYSFAGEDRGELKWGWVGVRIQPPPWDDGTIKRQYFVADWSLADPEIVKTLQVGLNAQVSRNLDTKIEWLAPDVMHTILDDEDHGVFETHARMREYRGMPAETTRFWMLVPVDGPREHHHDPSGLSDATGGQFRPISFDLVNTPGTHYVVDGTGWLSHTRTDEHGAVPGAAGNVGGLLFTGFDWTVTLGPQPEGIILNKTWIH